MPESPLLPSGYDIAWSVLVVVCVALVVWALVSILRSGMDPVARLVWAIVVIALPVLGPILWLVYKSRLPTFDRIP